MIESMKLLRILYRQHILNILHNTDGRGIPTRVCTDRTNIGITDIMATLTIMHFLFHLGDSLDKGLHVLRILP